MKALWASASAISRQGLSRSLLPFFCLPAVILLGAYVAICLSTGTPWPWTRVVHEDGQRTLLGMIFYFEHILQELPLDILLGVAVAGGLLCFYPSDHARSTVSPNPQAGLLRWFAVAMIAVIALILTGTLLVGGEGTIFERLTQMVTRPGVPPTWGSHWHYHLLSRLSLILLPFSLAGLYQKRPPALAGLRLFGGTLFIFGFLTLFFGLRWEPFRDPRFLGHQLRELFTHTLVTLPLALGTCLWLIKRLPVQMTGSSSQKSSRFVYATGTFVALLGIYLMGGAILTGAKSEGQTQSLTRLIFPHFFEHSFTYLITPLVAGFCTLWAARKSSPPVEAA